MVVLTALLGGYATPVESAALAALYALIVQRFIHRDLPSSRDVVRVTSDCVGLVGGVLVILAVAVGLTNYLVDAQMPDALIDVDAAARPLAGCCSCWRSTCSCWSSAR